MYEDPYDRPYYPRTAKRRSVPQEPEKDSGGLFSGVLAFGLGAATVLVAQKFWRQIAKTAVTGAVRAQNRVREISAEVMEDLEDAWAEESEKSSGPDPSGPKPG